MSLNATSGLFHDPAWIASQNLDARTLAFQVLNHGQAGLFHENLLRRYFLAHPLAQNERSLSTEIVHGVTRWQGRLDHILHHFSKSPGKNIESAVRWAVLIGLYQIYFTDRIPEYAIVDTSVSLAKKFSGLHASRFVNAVLRRAIREKDKIPYPDVSKDPAKFISVFYSHPQWLAKRWLSRYGLEHTIAFCEWNNLPPRLYFRPNTKRITPEELLEKMKDYRGELEESGQYVALKQPGNISEIPAIREGLAVVQDPSSGLVAALLNLTGGERVLDVCAAPGGKATWIAERCDRLTACDKTADKINRLRENFERTGLPALFCRADGLLPPFRSGVFDAVIVDAPCSNTGVLARRPESRWVKTQRDIQRLAVTQKEMLASSALLVKENGVLVYSTCSMEPEENEDLVGRFLKKNPAFVLENASGFVSPKYVNSSGYLRVTPWIHRLDGMFGARMRRVA